MLAVYVRAREATSRRVTSVRTAAVPISHLLFPGLKHGVIRFVCGEHRVEERGDILEGCRVQTQAVIVKPQLQQCPLYCMEAWRRASSARRGSQRDESLLTVVRHGSYDSMVSFIDGPEGVVYRKGVPVRMRR